MLNPDTAARIKACQGTYSLSDTARQFGVSTRTVSDLWHGRTHTSVPVAPETPYVKRSRIPAAEIKEEAEWLLRAGTPLEETAARIGVSPKRIVKEVSPSLLVV